MSDLFNRHGAKKVVLHHLGDGQPGARTVEELQRRANPYNYQFAEYDFGILEDGTVVTLRPLDYIGAHCIASVPKYLFGDNWWNKNSIGVVIAIDATKYQPSEAMVNGLIKCLVNLCGSQSITIDDIYPHFQVTATACPGASYGKLSLHTGYLDYDYVERTVAKGGVVAVTTPAAVQTPAPEPSLTPAETLPNPVPITEPEPPKVIPASQTKQDTVTVATVPSPNQKAWYDSKTIWVNAVMLAAMVAQQATGHDILTPDIQVSVIAVINVALRLLTKDAVTWK